LKTNRARGPDFADTGISETNLRRVFFPSSGFTGVPGVFPLFGGPEFVPVLEILPDVLAVSEAGVPGFFIQDFPDVFESAFNALPASAISGVGG